MIQFFLTFPFFALSQIIRQHQDKIKSHIVQLNQPTQIAEFYEFGIALDHLVNYTNQYLEEPPCKPISQKMEFRYNKQDSVIPLFNFISEQDFEKSFIDGQFTGRIPEILSMIHVDSGALLLTNEAKLYLIEIFIYTMGEKRLKKYVSQSFDLNITSAELNQKIFMVYNYLTKRVIIFLRQSTIILMIEKDNRLIFLKESKLVLHTNIQKVIWSGYYIYVASEEEGVQIYVDNLEDDIVLVASIEKVKATEIKVVTLNILNEVLYLMDKNQGILIYKIEGDQKYSILTPHVTLFDMPAIGQQNGVTFDIYGFSLMAIYKESNEYYAVDYHINVTIREWSEINRYKFNSELKQIDLTDQYAIILGTQGNYLLYHSIHKQFYTNQNVHKSLSELILPEMSSIDFYTHNLYYQQYNKPDIHHNIIFGYNKYYFFINQLKQIPIQIVCFSDDIRSVDHVHYFKYFLNSTQCPAKKDVENDFEMCSYEQEFKVMFRYAVVTKAKLFWVILVISVVVLCFIFIFGLFIKQYSDFKYNVEEIQQNIDSYKNEGFQLNEDVKNDLKESQPRYIQADIQSNAKSPNIEVVQNEND